ncbi:unnamed protein product [Cylicocyclus nassatus]|uniref:Kinesin motor domain-containing protein n=1 Tax=Cylicocyclus nassatus TaxID=53992 RepID=A0AA36H8Q6_CYLNA|nr:unnamed protein product [Cylicocyclus nassatus]
MAEDRISVVARIRPGWGENQIEWVKNGERNIMKKDGTEIYTFDNVFDQLCSNEVIYENVMAGLVDAALSGFNTAVCAYGQSGAGKTHTLTGSENEDGLVQNTFRALLETIAKASDREYMMRISYIEIYNERVRDLLSDNSMDLPIYENKDGVAQIDGLTEEVVTENAQVAELLEKAQDRRQLGETRLNERSSRSHTIIRLTIESHDVNHGNNATRCSVMNLVDLAGSENAAAAGTNGLRQKEGANINRSLLALSKVVSSLADNQKFIPYRDSKLTRILKPSLGGNSKTVIICCVAPFSIAETSSTLKFAKLAKKIVTRPVVNEVSDDGVLAGYLREIAELKEKLEKANNKKDEEEKGREQRMKLAELTKGILNGRNALEAAPVLSRKTRRQTWAPGNGMLGLLNRRSFSPPCKKERGLGLIDEYEGQKSSETIDDVDMDIKRSLSRASSELVSEKREVEVQTTEPYPIDQSDEVVTLKKGNEMLLRKLDDEKKRCHELENQVGEFTETLQSMKDNLNQLQEISSWSHDLEKKLANAELKNEDLMKENMHLEEEIVAMKMGACENETTPADRVKLLTRIDELHSELRLSKDATMKAMGDNNTLSDENEQLQLLTKDLQNRLSENAEEIVVLQGTVENLKMEMKAERRAWNSEKEAMFREVQEMRAIAAMSSDTLIEAKDKEINELRKALEEKTGAASEAFAKMQEQYTRKLEENNEELLQLRKNNADLQGRIDALMLESEDAGDDHEMQLLKEENMELKEVIDHKSKLLEVAEKQKRELDYANMTIERLTREKKELAARLKTKSDGTEVLSSRLNKMRDELNEKDAQLSQLQHAQKSYELAKEKLKKENALLTEAMENLRRKALADDAEAKATIHAQDVKIAQLHEQAADSRHKILVLDTDLAIARKDLEVYKNTVESMAKAQNEAQALASQETQLKQQLEDMSAELSLFKEVKGKLEMELATKERLLKGAMDSRKEYEMDTQALSWLREKAKMSQQIEDLQRQLIDATDALEQRQTTSSDSRYREERKRFLEEIESLQQRLKKATASKAAMEGTSNEVADLKQCLDASKKENQVLMEKITRYRMQKINGIQYVDELKEQISQMRKEIDEFKKKESLLKQELERMKKINADLEALCRENKITKNVAKNPFATKRPEERRPLQEEPECKQQ